MDRCNLTVLEEPGQEDTAEFLAQAIKSVSLPHYLATLKTMLINNAVKVFLKKVFEVLKHSMHWDTEKEMLI